MRRDSDANVAVNGRQAMNREEVFIDEPDCLSDMDAQDNLFHLLNGGCEDCRGYQK